MKAAEELLEGDASLIAIVEGYYSMLHKANEALAQAGFKTGTHKCTLLGLRGVFKTSSLAQELQKAMDERINADYYINPGKTRSRKVQTTGRIPVKQRMLIVDETSDRRG